MIRVGIIGAGAISHSHIAAYQKLEDVKIAAVCDINNNRASSVASTYKIEKTYDRHTDLVNDPDIDAGSVVTWNNSHMQISIDALNAGKHVLCEKPVAMNAEEAEKMVEAARSSGCILLPGFCTRYEDGVRLLKRYIDADELGHIYYAKAAFLRRYGSPGGWFADRKLSGGGPVIDLGVHILDLARFLMGAPMAVTVTAEVYNHIGSRSEIEGVNRYLSVDFNDGSDVEESAVALIRFDNGLTVHFETSWLLNLKEDVFQLEVFGSKAGARLYPKIELYGDKFNHLVNSNPQYSNNENLPNYDFDMEIRHFIRCIRGEEKCICTPEDGLEMMRIIDAVYESARSHREILIRR